MGFLNSLFRKKSDNDHDTVDRGKALPPLRPIGHDDGRCPYCSTPLVKLPRQKRPCPQCGKLVFPRKRPVDGKVVLFSEEELEELDEQRAIAYGNYESYLMWKSRKENARAKLRKKFGGEPSESDVNWSLLVDNLIQEAKEQCWGSYRVTKEAMAQQLTQEGKTKAALHDWMEAAYLDMNGANNCCALTCVAPQDRGLTNAEREDWDRYCADRGLEAPQRQFDLREADLQISTVMQIHNCCQTLGISVEDAKSIFESACHRAPAKSLHPRSPQQAWIQLREALDEYAQKSAASS